jgi:hypothetical protein
VGGAERAKHMDLRKFFVHDAVKAKEIQLVGVSSERMRQTFLPSLVFRVTPLKCIESTFLVTD